MPAKTVSGIALAAMILSIPIATDAQQQGKVVTVAVLSGVAPSASGRVPLDDVLEQALREMGWANTRLVVRHTGDGRVTARHVTEVVRLGADVIVAWGLAAAVPAAQATTKVPIVFLAVSDPIRYGLASSLARPGGNATGVTMFAGVEMFPKMLQILKHALPAVSRCTVVVLAPESGTGAPQVFKDLRPMMAASAKALGLELQEFHVPTLAQLEPGVRQAKSQGTQALYVWLTPLAFSSGKELAEAALANGLPSIHPYADHAVAGGLLAYAASLDNMARQGAAYVDKILRGAEPAHLPVAQPTKFDLVVNLKTARTLGLTISPSVLLQADRIIE